VRLSDKVSPRTVAHVLFLLALMVALAVMVHSLNRPGLALLLLAAYIGGRLAYVRWRRPT
jgi:multisubunit Na+/H+ antiporter MnhB subunit